MRRESIWPSPDMPPPRGTSRYRTRHGERCSARHFTEADRLWWSSVGLGSYLGGVDDPTDNLVMRAFARCVAGGVNVIDTAINYRCQRAERCLGHALSAQIDAGVVARDEIILCTKGGYLPHPDRADWFVSEIVRPSRGRFSSDDLVGGSHCMHPDYIDDQIERSPCEPESGDDRSLLPAQSGIPGRCG